MSLMRLCLLSAFLATVASTCADAQIVVSYEDTNPATGTSNTIPWAQNGGYTTIHIYTATELHAAGVAPFSLLTDFAVAPVTGGSYNAPTAQILIGHLVEPTVNPNAWASALDTPALVWDPAFGPYSFPYTANTWTSLPGFNLAGFTWDGVRDIGVYITTSAGVTGGFNARRTNGKGRCGVTVYQATNQTPTTTGYFAMKAQMTFSGVAPQQNTPEATLLVGGQAGATTLEGGDTFNFTVSSTSAPLNPFYLLMSTGLTGGHLPLTGQTIDVGFAPFGFADVFIVSPFAIVPALSGGGSFFDILDPAGNYSFNFIMPCGVSLPRNYVQALVFDPTHPNAIRSTGVPSFALNSSCRYFATGPLATTILDGTTATFTFTVPAGTTINDVDLQLDTSHPTYTDWNIVLSHNGVTTVSLKDTTTADVTDIVGRYRFSDEATMTFDQAALLSGTAILPGRYIGDNPLSAFDGVDAGGTWTLTISDAVTGSTGQVLGASLIINGQQ